MNILQLRQTITVLVGDLAGSYVLPSGAKQAALYVEGKYGVPKEWKIEGLEVVMRQYPEILSQAMVGTVRKTKLWEVMLSQYEPSNENLEPAIDRILRHFPDATIRNFPSSDRGFQYARIIIVDVDIVFQYQHTV